MSEQPKVYDFITGEYTTIERSMKANHDRQRWELLKRKQELEPPRPGYGLDGYPLQRGKRRADRVT